MCVFERFFFSIPKHTSIGVMLQLSHVGSMPADHSVFGLLTAESIDYRCSRLCSSFVYWCVGKGVGAAYSAVSRVERHSQLSGSWVERLPRQLMAGNSLLLVNFRSQECKRKCRPVTHEKFD